MPRVDGVQLVDQGGENMGFGGQIGANLLRSEGRFPGKRPIPPIVSTTIFVNSADKVKASASLAVGFVAFLISIG